MKKNVQYWLDGPFDEKTKEEIRRLLKTDPKALEDAFFKDLEFGTGGMRGIMGVGTNRMNLYTIGKATQGLAQYLKKHAKKTLRIHRLRCQTPFSRICRRDRARFKDERDRGIFNQSNLPHSSCLLWLQTFSMWRWNHDHRLSQSP